MGRKKMEPGTTKGDRAERLREAKATPRSGPEEMAMYASGSGALSFWQRMDHDLNSRVAIGRTVTMDDARDYLSSTQRCQKLIADGWRLWSGDGGGPYLIAPVERTGPNTIKMGEREYTYHVNQTDPFFIRDGEIRQVSLSLTYIEPTEEFEPEDHRTVRNVGTLASAAFFLNHEKDLKANPPEEFTYEVVK